jgi:hypothetical protein
MFWDLQNDDHFGGWPRADNLTWFFSLKFTSNILVVELSHRWGFYKILIKRI